MFDQILNIVRGYNTYQLDYNPLQRFIFARLNYVDAQALHVELQALDLDVECYASASAHHVDVFL